MNTLCELLLPFARVGSSTVAFKGPGVEQEMPAAANALKVLHGEARILSTKLSWGDRRLVCIKKLERTPAKYPRQAGTPKRLPL
jgi:16S rRNA (guanine527-N7)-methyltransferase